MSENANESMTEIQECFVIMPFSDPDGYEPGHFTKVYQDIFKPAIEKAGFKPHRADDNKASSLIHIEFLKKLLECPICICDLSSRNPNVLFELGLRQAFDKPVVLVQEKGTPRIFDISGINTIDYQKEMKYRQVLADQNEIATALKQTFNATKDGNSINSIVRLLSISNPATIPEISEAKKDPVLQLILSEINKLANKTHYYTELNKIQHSPEFGIDVLTEEKLYNSLRPEFKIFRKIVNEQINKDNKIDKTLIDDIRKRIDLIENYEDEDITSRWFILKRDYILLLSNAVSYNNSHNNT